MSNLIGRPKVADVTFLQYENPTTEIVDYGVKMLGAELEWNSLEKVTGKGVRVLVLDTGRPQHDDLEIADSRNFTDSPDEFDHHGHSTHVCGIIGARWNNRGIIGVAPRCTIYTGKVLGDDGYGNWEWIVEGIKWGIELGVHVINLSLGDIIEPPEIVHDTIKDAYNAGITIVAAAGNTGWEMKHYPAAYDEVIATTAVDIYGQKALFSNIGLYIDAATAGVDILSTYLNNTYARLSGTSMACPMLTGAIALLIEKGYRRHGRWLTPDEIKFLVSIYCEDSGIIGIDKEYGYGIFTFGTVLTKQYTEIVTKIGSREYTVNGEQKTMDVAPYLDLEHGRTMLPVRFIAEELGAEVEWNGEDQTVTFKREIEVPWRSTLNLE